MRWEKLPLVRGSPPGIGIWLWREEPEKGEYWSGDISTHCRFPERSQGKILIEYTGQVRTTLGIGKATSSDELLRLKEGEFLWSFTWGDYVGLSRLRVEVDGQVVLDLPVEVYSRKLDYEQDYRHLLDELADWLAALAFSVCTPTTLPTAVEAPGRGSLYLIYLVLRRLMAHSRVPAAFERVRTEPHRRLVREARRVDLALARQVDARTLADLVVCTDMARGSRGVSPPIARALRGYVPTYLTDTRPCADFDTPENRFVAYLLQVLGRKLGDVERAFQRDATEHTARADLARSLAGDCRRWAREVGEMERASFLEEVGPMAVFPAASQVLRRREGYRELRDAYQRLLLIPHVRWQGLEELLAVPSRDVPTLYEYWCFFALADALARVTGIHPDWQGMVQWKHDHWEVGLQPGQVSALHIGPATLLYNREFQRDSYSLPLRPDYTVELEGRRWLFDAKYRLEWQDIEAALEGEVPTEVEREATFKRADLYKMHTYRDAIRGAEAVFVLYPGTGFRAFGADGHRCENPADLLPGFAGVGAVPLRPGQTGALEAVVRVIDRH